jgi:RNA 3'-terminal phosphate cyclase (ATP)
VRARFELTRAGFYPPGGGEMSAEVQPWPRPAGIILDERGALRAVRGVSAAGRIKGDVARRQADAVQARLWEAQRLESTWDVLDVPSASPGSYLYLELEFERGRGAFGFLGERGIRAEQLGDRAARHALKFLEAEGAVDPHLADQLALPLAIGGVGGRITTPEVTLHLESVAAVVRQFGIPARTWGRRGGPGGLEVERC